MLAGCVFGRAGELLRSAKKLCGMAVEPADVAVIWQRPL
jgi:hypothetical protein